MIGDLVGFGLSTFLLDFMIGGILFTSIKNGNVKAGVMKFRSWVYKITDVTAEAKSITLERD